MHLHISSTENKNCTHLTVAMFCINVYKPGVFVKMEDSICIHRTSCYLHAGMTSSDTMTYLTARPQPHQHPRH